MDERTALILAAFLAAALIFEAGQQFERIRQRRKQRREPRDLPAAEQTLRRGICPICYGQKGTAFGDCGFCRGTGRPPGIVTLTEEERQFLIASVPYMMADIVKNCAGSVNPVPTVTRSTYQNLMRKDFERIIGFFTKPQTEEEQKK